VSIESYFTENVNSRYYHMEEIEDLKGNLLKFSPRLVKELQLVK
jgi:hypothetical protein